MEGAGGVAVATPPSLSTDLGDDNTAGGRMAASPTVSRSDASGCQPARSGRSVDSHSLQRRQAAIGAALHRLGSEQQSPSGGDASSGGVAAARHRAKRPRNVALEKVWGWLEGGTLAFGTPAAASPAPAAVTSPLATPEVLPAELCSRQGSVTEPLPYPAAAAAAVAAAPGTTARGGLAEALAHSAQPSRPLKRKSSVMAPPASPTLPPPSNPGAPEVDLECMLAHSNLERSRVARLDDAALAQHDAALLAGLEGPQGSTALPAHADEATSGFLNPAAPSVSQWASLPTAAVAIPTSSAAVQPFGSSVPAAAAANPDFSFSIGSAGPSVARAGVSSQAAPQFGGGTVAQPMTVAAKGMPAAAYAAREGFAAGVGGSGGIAASAPPKLSPAAAAAAAGQRRRRSLPHHP